MEPVVFRDDDLGFVTWVAENPDGYVLNIQRGLSTADARVHSAACGHIARAIADVLAAHQRRLTSSYIKVCSPSVSALDEWSARRLGTEIRRCPSCQVVGRATSEQPRQRTRDQSLEALKPDDLDLQYRISVSSDEVAMDAPRYLPFERLDQEQLQARGRLRDALAGLTAGPGEVLHAWYSGSRPPNSDVENLVLYCIDSGGASFIRASSFGVRFELDSRSRDGGAPCRYCYRVLPAAEALGSWRRGQRLAQFADVDLAAFRSEHRLAQTWMAIHNTPAQTQQPSASVRGAFGVFLELLVPPSSPPGVRPEMVKSLVDGVVCAFQTHLDESTVADMAGRIANQIRADPDDVGRKLLSADRAVLGAQQRLVHMRGAGVQWNPSDQRCVAGQVLRHSGARWRLAGEIYALTPLRNGPSARPTDGSSER